MTTWPPTLTDLKQDMGPEFEDDGGQDDDRLQLVLDASVAFVERVRSDVNFDGDLGSDLEDVSPDLVLGTLRLASRWHTRRRSPDALIQMAEMGASRVPTFDPDIERLLQIGRHQQWVCG
ncbi:hypothetical protein O7626_31405 [Micromonospora sp. WMMD1102]|uniref:hypothetical protein n=1 Tax=Micromonospora sp. WMMD1102 TaxID=3016105 RepID=UPI00241550C9|nr:hypothetical protein [Micromonospora sp. WMMD1102]MDG4790376.1 hypothetical protein [Micromonospora sp. WMMD1102]